MKIIAHRGLIDGKNLQTENSPAQIELALAFGFDVELDVWLIGDQFYLGHDNPEYKVTPEYFVEHHRKFWIHTKNLAALEWFTKNTSTQFNFFWHDVDAYIITSLGYIWTTNKSIYTDNSVIVIPEYPVKNFDDYKCYAVCCDYGKHVDFLPS